jgi:hypothetical protein
LLLTTRALFSVACFASFAFLFAQRFPFFRSRVSVIPLAIGKCLPLPRTIFAIRALAIGKRAPTARVRLARLFLTIGQCRPLPRLRRCRARWFPRTLGITLALRNLALLVLRSARRISGTNRISSW